LIPRALSEGIIKGKGKGDIMKKITGKLQKENFRKLLEETAKTAPTMIIAYQLAWARWQEKHG
jgi:hypothetical protein